MNEYNELVRFLRAKPSTAIIKYPTGVYGLVGSIPYEFTKESTGLFPQRVSMVWKTEDEVIKALLSIGVTRFQKADCSWYVKEA